MTTQHALTTNLTYLFNINRRNERYYYCSEANYYENYHLMTGVLLNFDANLKRLLWNGFGEP